MGTKFGCESCFRRVHNGEVMSGACIESMAMSIGTTDILSSLPLFTSICNYTFTNLFLLHRGWVEYIGLLL